MIIFKMNNRDLIDFCPIPVKTELIMRALELEDNKNWSPGHPTYMKMVTRMKLGAWDKIEKIRLPSVYDLRQVEATVSDPSRRATGYSGISALSRTKPIQSNMIRVEYSAKALVESMVRSLVFRYPYGIAFLDINDYFKSDSKIDVNTFTDLESITLPLPTFF